MDPDAPDNADKESDPREPERLTPEDIRSKCRELLCDTLKSDGEYVMGLVATEPVFRVSNKTRFKPVFSATETS